MHKGALLGLVFCCSPGRPPSHPSGIPTPPHPQCHPRPHPQPHPAIQLYWLLLAHIVINLGASPLYPYPLRPVASLGLPVTPLFVLHCYLLLTYCTLIILFAFLPFPTALLLHQYPPAILGICFSCDSPPTFNPPTTCSPHAPL